MIVDDGDLPEESREMTKDEILEYLFICVCYKYNTDSSHRITKAALEKENKLFESAVKFLMNLDKEKHVFNKTEQFLKENEK